MKRSVLLTIAALFIVSGIVLAGFFTRLKVTVLNEIGNPVEGAKVQLFETLEDYRDDTNPVTEEKVTDEEGEVLFKDLDEKAYYIAAQKDSLSNHGTATQVDTLRKNRVNKVNVIIK